MLDYFFFNLVLITSLGICILLLSGMCRICAQLIQKDRIIQQQQKLLLNNLEKLHELERKIMHKQGKVESGLKEQWLNKSQKDKRLKPTIFPHWPSNN